MPRGQASQIGDKTVNANGYEYEKTERGWVATSVLVMEEHLGRRLAPNEYVSFKDGHKPPITLDMLVLRRKGDRKSPERRLAEIEVRIEELQAERELILEEINGPA